MKTTVSIPGMHCDSCATLIKDVSSEFPAIRNVQVDLGSKQVALEYEEGLDLKKWTEDIESLGEKYKVSIIS